MNDQKKRRTAAWIWEFAGAYRPQYVLSVFSAVCGVVCGILPYFVMADVIADLLDGCREPEVYLKNCLLMALLWVGRCGFHSISTSLSHKATFAVLGNIRKRDCAKLSRVPLGTVLVTIPLGFGCYLLMIGGYQESYQNTVNKTKILNDTAVEYINGIEVIKAFGKAQSSYEKFAVAAREGAECYVEWMRRCNVYFCMAMAIFPATMIAVLPIGGLLFRAGTLDADTFIRVILFSVGLLALLAVVLMSGGQMEQKVAELVLTLPILFLLVHFVSPAIRQFSRRPARSQVQFGVIPAVYYIFDYATVVYTDILTSGSPVVVEFMPLVCCAGYLVFLLYCSAVEQKRGQLTQTQDSLDIQLNHFFLI